MKPAEPGTPFAVSLPEGGYAFGYVTYWNYGPPAGANCVLMNIFDYRADTSDAMENAFTAPLLIRDLLNEAGPFGRTKINLKLDTYWPLNRKKRVPDALLPKYDWVGGNGLRQIWTGEKQIRPMTLDERRAYPEWSIQSPEFYPLYILGQLTDRHVVLVEKVRDADGKTVSPARFELRGPDQMDGLRAYGFAGAADTLIPDA